MNEKFEVVASEDGSICRTPSRHVLKVLPGAKYRVRSINYDETHETRSHSLGDTKKMITSSIQTLREGEAVKVYDLAAFKEILGEDFEKLTS